MSEQIKEFFFILDSKVVITKVSNYITITVKRILILIFTALNSIIVEP